MNADSPNVSLMTLPTTYVAALLMILSMLCWGSWANTQKLAGKWRFELYSYHLTVGVALAQLSWRSPSAPSIRVN
jgi:glucose uptake protein